MGPVADRSCNVLVYLRDIVVVVFVVVVFMVVVVVVMMVIFCLVVFVDVVGSGELLLVQE